MGFLSEPEGAFTLSLGSGLEEESVNPIPGGR